MSGLIQMYLNRIKLSPGELYTLLMNYTLSEMDRRVWGFPLYDKCHPDKVVRFYIPGFDISPDPKIQVCRCGKMLSLLKEDWYVDEAGCDYHWGKKLYNGGPKNGLYSCCKSSSRTDGCIHHKYHACGFKPMESDSFMSTHKIILDKSSANVFALDCEMVYTTVGLEVARVSLITLRGDTVYDSYVQPPNTILDCNTAFSGIKLEDLKGVKTTVADARASILELLNKDSILVGHGLENDLLGLHLLHDILIDTSILYQHESGFPFRHSLKVLGEKYLGKTVVRHDSVEDARMCIALLLQKLNFDAYMVKNSSKSLSKHCALQSVFCSPPAPFLRSNYFRCLTYCSSPILVIPRIVQLKFPSFITPLFPLNYCPPATMPANMSVLKIG